MKTRKHPIILFFKPLSWLFMLLASTKADAMETKFAIIGDFGEWCEQSVHVSELVKSWDPDFILSTGDNNYPEGAEETIDKNVGSLYGSYIYPYQGQYEKSPVPHNRFFPCLGNHDFDTGYGEPYFNFFTFLKKEYYYDFVKGPIHFFALCSDDRGPDGISEDSKQLQWLKEKVMQSKAQWKVVYFHHPAYSSEVIVPPRYKNNVYTKNRERRINAPFHEWGVSVVINGHLHIYERFLINNVPYITNGLGGGKILYEFCDKDPQSLVRFTGEHGALLAEAGAERLSFKFITITKKVEDSFTLEKTLI